MNVSAAVVRDGRVLAKSVGVQSSADTVRGKLAVQEKVERMCVILFLNRFVDSVAVKPLRLC